MLTSKHLLVLGFLGCLAALIGCQDASVAPKSTAIDRSADEAYHIEAENDVAAVVGQVVDQDSVETVRPVPLEQSPLEQPPLEQPLARHNPGFVGSAACAACHRERFDSFQETHHARSLQLPNSSQEAELASFDHDKSDRSFCVYRSGSQVRHADWIVLPGDRKYPLNDEPITHVMGSGAFAKSYLFRHDGFWFQAPMTFYQKPAEYDLSPGYDRVEHHGFTRQITDECLVCHAGGRRSDDANPNRFELTERSIGCERCHGPGQAHSEDASAAIVHPGKLDRDRINDLCAQCHLQGEIRLFTAQNNGWDYQPGQPLGHNRVVYRFEDSEKHAGSEKQSGSKKHAGSKKQSGAEFVGHVEQLTASRCFQESQDMSCITCHDPHHQESETDKLVRHREQCFQCHDDSHCGVSMQIRMTDNENDCASCHMPKSDSVVIHAAVSNHNIAVYPKTPTQTPAPAATPILPQAIALLDDTSPGTWQRRLNQSSAVGFRLLSEASVEYSNAKSFARAADELSEAIDIAAREVDKDEFAEMESSTVVSLETARSVLAQLLIKEVDFGPPIDWGRDDPERMKRVMGLLSEVIQNVPPESQTGQSAISSAATVLFDLKMNEKSIAYFEHLTGVRRMAADHYNLGLLYARMRRFAEAKSALQMAIKIQPDYVSPYRSLAILFANIDRNAAREFAVVATELDNHARKKLDK